MRLAEEHQDNIVPGARLLLFSDLGIGIAVRNEIDLDVAFVGLLKLLRPALQVLIRRWHEVVESQHGQCPCGSIQRWRFGRQDSGKAHRGTCGSAQQRPPAHVRRYRRGVNRHDSFLLCPELSKIEAMLLNLIVHVSNYRGVIVYPWRKAVNKKTS